MITISLSWGRWLCGIGVLLYLVAAAFEDATPWVILAAAFLLSTVALYAIATWRQLEEAKLRRD